MVAQGRDLDRLPVSYSQDLPVLRVDKYTLVMLL